MPADLGTAQGVQTLSSYLTEHETRVHALFNNAGANWGAPLDDPARVINTGSVDGLRAPALGFNNFSYSASKAEQIPLRRIGRPEDMAGIALFLMSPASSYVTGAVIPVDGGVLATR